MTATLECESTLTDRYQTTVPETVRRALRLSKRDKIRYAVQPDGAVVMTRASVVEDDDPVIEAFLQSLTRDILQNPAHVHAVEPSLPSRIDALVAGVKITLDDSAPAEGQ